MTSLTELATEVEAAWHAGVQAELAGRLDAAYAHFRQAHDLVVACPKMHRQAHRHLRRINQRRRAWRELGTDLVLLSLAPLASFEIVAYLMKGQVLGGHLCKQ
jgi:hypothetical protein